VKTFKAWLLLDVSGTYFPSLHATRREADFDRVRSKLRDADWRIVRVLVQPSKRKKP
jgi:hypothetical protein